MMLKKWDDLPDQMKNEKVKYYYDILSKKRFSLLVKRVFDLVLAIITLFILFPFFIGISILIKIDSRGPVFFSQIRITQYGKKFKIYKFRTMLNNAEEIGAQITSNNDSRITKIGTFLRKYRLDELPQLINIITGDMSFVGTRPEVIKYVEKYSEEMWATLLLPAGVTSEASIMYKDESSLIDNKKSVEEIDYIYINEILPIKMRYNYKSIRCFSFKNELLIIIRTVLAVIGDKQNCCIN